MNKYDPEFEETLKNIFSHKIIDTDCIGKTQAGDFLGASQGGLNACDIIAVEQIFDVGKIPAERIECWSLTWDYPHPFHNKGKIWILLDKPDERHPFWLD